MGPGGNGHRIRWHVRQRTGWTTVTCECGWHAEAGSEVEAGWRTAGHRRSAGVLR